MVEYYLFWLVVMLLIVVWCFLLDGVFIGVIKGKEMWNSMVVLVVVFFVIYGFMIYYGNYVLWLVMFSFMVLCGFILGVIFYI